MKPSAYASYKPSGVEWLGDIPSHWQPKRMRFLLTQKLQYGANEAAELDDPELPRYVRITDIDEQGTLREETFRSLPVEIAKPYLLKDGDILFARSGATSGKTFLYRNSWGTCAYAGYLIRARLNQGKLLPSFLRYFTASANYWQWLSASTIQATIQNVSAEKYADLWLTYPPIAEQQTIADFLDTQAAKIDTLLAKKRQFIAKLKEKRSALIARTVTRGLPPAAAQTAGLEPHPAMKDSGVEWIGSIPATWRIERLRRICHRVTDGAHISPDLSADDFPFVSTVDISDGKINMTQCLRTSRECYDYLVRAGCKPFAGDVLFSKDGTVGRTAVIDFDADFVVASSLVIVSPIKKLLDTVFLDYWLNNNLLQQEVTLQMAGAALRRISVEKVARLPVLMPPLQEQQAIATYLDRETARIDQLTAKVEAAIERLTEYRQALITAAVTGKIDVRQYNTQKGAQHATVTLS